MLTLRWRIAVAIAAVLAGAPAAGFARWIDATRPEPATQVQRLDADSFVIRQSIATNFEGPFLYLLFGRDRVLLLDSGAGGTRIRPTVDALIARWSAARHRAAPPLIVAHSHSHGDHIRGDADFVARPDTTVVGRDPAAVATAFGIADWPTGRGRIDLGGRVIDVLATPGHEAAHIMLYDARTRTLLSGDTLYPGRLYFPAGKLATFRASIDRVVAFAATQPVRRILGAHIEMARDPGVDYPRRASAHPREHRLDLPPASLAELAASLAAMGDVAVRDVRRDFIVTPLD